MKIIIAPNSFKESLAATEVAEHLKAGFLKGMPGAKIICLPIADGGDGTLEALISSCKGTIKEQVVEGPLGELVSAQWGLIDGQKTAVIEMAQASGLKLVTLDKRNPLLTSTYGTGQLIKAALDSGVDKIIVGIGGSATVDGGMGMLSALGVSFSDDAGRLLKGNGHCLGKIQLIDCAKLHPGINRVKFLVASDVKSPLIGEAGAAGIFGPQKGATPEMVELLEQNMQHYAVKIKELLHKDMSYVPGAGAAGGLGAALMAFMDAELKPGIEIILAAVNFQEALKDAELVITGEGRLDSQTAAGKAPLGVAGPAHDRGIPVIGIAGEVSGGASVLLKAGFTALFSLVNGPMSLEEALKNTPALLENIAEQIARTLKVTLAGKGLKKVDKRFNKL